MTEPEPTLRTLCFDDPAGAASTLAAELRSGAAAEDVRGALGRLPRAARNALFDEVGEVAAGVLDLGVTDLFARAWDQHAALRRAAAESLADPDTTQAVELVTHTMSIDYEPGVEILVGDLHAAMVRIEAHLEVTVRGLLAVVRAGLLVAVRVGAADVTAALAVLGQRLTEHHTTIDLPAALRLGRGIPLLPDPATARHRRDP